MKKIRLICLCLTGLSLSGCFHVPDEDWLLSKDKVNSGDIAKENEVEEAVDSFMDGINMISSEWDEIKNEKSGEITTENLENVESGESVGNEIENEEIANMMS